MLGFLMIVVLVGGIANGWIFSLILVLFAFFLGRGLFLLARQSK
ncbi:hypothetical protein [Amycolatopsis sp. NPDC021455]